MLLKPYLIFLTITFFLLTSCSTNTGSPIINTATPDIPVTTMVSTKTSVPLTTPSPKNEAGEVVLLLHRREKPADVMIVRLTNDCLMSKTDCSTEGNILASLPESLAQVQSIYWTNDGAKAFFADDNEGNIYAFDASQGKFQIFKKEVWKARDHFVISPDGSQAIFEIQKGDFETDLVSMNLETGNITKFDIPDVCAKYISQWINNSTILFWCEYSEGKGYLSDLKVNTMDIVTQRIQPFDLGRNWMQTTIPLFSQDGNLMAFTTESTVVIRSVSTAEEQVLNVPVENLLWSADSKSLAIFGQNKEISMMRSDSSELQKMLSLSENDNLQDWMWLPDQKHILLIISDEIGNQRVGVLSMIDKTLTPLNLALLQGYDAVSISFRP